MNTLSLKDIYLKKSYEAFDPRMKMIISKNDGLFDNCFNLIKDQLICFHQFNKLDNNGIKVIKPPKNKKERDSRFEYIDDYKEKMKKVKVKRIK